MPAQSNHDDEEDDATGGLAGFAARGASEEGRQTSDWGAEPPSLGIESKSKTDEDDDDAFGRVFHQYLQEKASSSSEDSDSDDGEGGILNFGRRLSRGGDGGSSSRRVRRRKRSRHTIGRQAGEKLGVCMVICMVMAIVVGASMLIAVLVKGGDDGVESAESSARAGGLGGATTIQQEKGMTLAPPQRVNDEDLLFKEEYEAEEAAKKKAADEAANEEKNESNKWFSRWFGSSKNPEEGKKEPSSYDEDGEEERLETAEQIVTACSERALREDRSGCQRLCSADIMCCFESSDEDGGKYSCEDDEEKDCALYAGCESLIAAMADEGESSGDDMDTVDVNEDDEDEDEETTTGGKKVGATYSVTIESSEEKNEETEVKIESSDEKKGSDEDEEEEDTTETVEEEEQEAPEVLKEKAKNMKWG